MGSSVTAKLLAGVLLATGLPGVAFAQPANPTPQPPALPPALFETGYGRRLTDSSDVWWCESARKVGKQRALPSADVQSSFVPLQLARNEYEAVQIVARPEKNVTNVTAVASDFVGPNGARLAAKNIAIDQVEYVNVRFPTDRIGSTGEWPDPLPPMKQRIALKADTNQPFWVTAFAPKSTPAGVYSGTITLAGDGWKRKVPLRITVWDFTLTDETHIRSGLGLTPGRIAPYHNVEGKLDVGRPVVAGSNTTPYQTGEGNDLLKVVDLYLDNFAQHRISSYYPQFGSDIKVDWGRVKQASWPGGTLDDSQRYGESASLRVVDSDSKGAPAILSPRISVKFGQKYALKWAARTASDGQIYRVTVEGFDANGNWVPGGNQDFDVAGSTQWAMNTQDISPKINDPRVSSIQVALRPVRWTSSGEHTGTAWFDDVQVLDANGEDIFKGGGNFFAGSEPATAEQVKIDFTAFDRAIQHAVDKWHITGFRLALESGFVGSQTTYTSGSINGYTQNTPEYEILFGSYLRQLQAHLEEKGWLDLAYLYWADEPQPSIFPQLSAMAKTIERHAPKLKWLLTLNHPQDPLLKQVDIWTPILQAYNPAVAAQRKSEGKETWWYICVAPKTPYVGEFIDHPALEPRMWLWQTWQNKVDGILIWTTVLWNSAAKYPNSLQNPWDDAMSWTGSGGQWGNGDGRFLYPPNRHPNTDKRKFIEGPVNSMRWELLRDGIEDYEYFWMLQQQVNQLEKQSALSAAQEDWLRQARALLIVPDEISTSLTQYTSDPAPLMRRRAQLAAAISIGPRLAQ